VREAIAGVIRGGGATVRAMASLYEGAGFGAATLRAVVTGLNLLSRTSTPVKVFATMEAAAAWLSGMAANAGAEGFDAAAMASAAKALRAEVAAKGAA